MLPLATLTVIGKGSILSHHEFRCLTVSVCDILEEVVALFLELIDRIEIIYAGLLLSFCLKLFHLNAVIEHRVILPLGPSIQANSESIELELELAVSLDRLDSFRELTSLEWRSNILIVSCPRVVITLEEGMSELLITFPIENHVDAAVNLLLSLLFEILSLLKAGFPLVLRVMA